MKNKEHLTKSGLEKITKIVEKMNLDRNNSSLRLANANV